MSRSDASLPFVARFKAELERLVQEIELAGDALGGRWQPKLDVVETGEELLFLLEVPGLAAADLEVSVAGDVVTVSGEKRSPPPAGDGVRFQCVEREQGRFARRIKLLRPVNSHAGRARLEGGVLTVRFPKIRDQRQAAYTLEIVEPEEEESSS